MDTQTAPRNRIHPLVATAAVAVTLASAVGVAAMTGMLPSGTARQGAPALVSQIPAPPPQPIVVAAPEPVPAPAPVVQPAPKPVVKAAPVAKPKPVRHEQVHVAQAPQQEAPRYEPQPLPQVAPQEPAVPHDYRPARVAAARSVCQDCGVVESMREIAQKGEGTGLGAVAGGVLGAVLGHQVGGGKGRQVATVVGAAGGAYGGHQVEKNARGTKTYEVSVRMEDGGYRTVAFDSAPTWRAGDRVRVVNGTLQSNPG